ncbi:hypothetical protein M426DRAFT_25750 [Hypoxylon sp. CI-4A]|nr:hypothetical protein M426DRAFT_25750 [Hypoxylon sp. CI-4A]
MAPTLMSMLPWDGFDWESKTDRHFLRSQQSRELTRAMRRAGRPMSESVVIDYIAELFVLAREQITSAKGLAPEEFWKSIGSQIRWASYIGGTQLYTFSLKVICARNRFYEMRSSQKERAQRNPNFIMPPYYEKTHWNSANKAVDDFKGLAYNHPDLSVETCQGLYPMWTWDSDCEGRSRKIGPSPRSPPRGKEEADGEQTSADEHHEDGEETQENDVDEHMDDQEDDMEYEDYEEYEGDEEEEYWEGDEDHVDEDGDCYMDDGEGSVGDENKEEPAKTFQATLPLR